MAPRSRTKTKSKPAPKPKRGRYTAPAPKAALASKLWVPVTMFTMLATGVVVVALNYLELLPGGDGRVLFDVTVGHEDRAVEDTIDDVNMRYLDPLLDLTGDEFIGTKRMIGG
jgi:hypothetical protein